MYSEDNSSNKFDAQRNERKYEVEGLRNGNRLFYGWSYDMDEVLINWGL